MLYLPPRFSQGYSGGGSARLTLPRVRSAVILFGGLASTPYVESPTRPIPRNWARGYDRKPPARKGRRCRPRVGSPLRPRSEGRGQARNAEGCTGRGRRGDASTGSRNWPVYEDFTLEIASGVP